MIVLRALSIIVLFTMIEVLSACCDCDNTIRYGNYQIDDLSLSNLDNSGPYLNVTESNRIGKDAYGIQLNLSTVSLSCASNKNPSNFKSEGFFERSPDRNRTCIKSLGNSYSIH